MFVPSRVTSDEKSAVLATIFKDKVVKTNRKYVREKKFNELILNWRNTQKKPEKKTNTQKRETCPP